MKKLISLIILIVFILPPLTAGAAPLDFSGGVNNENEYKEIVFISGEPLEFTGEYKFTKKEKNNIRTLSYQFDLVPKDRTLDGKISRKITLEETLNKDDDKGQTISTTELTKYKETITIGDDKYTLEDYQFSKSDVIDNRPASDFYSGTLKGRKTYLLNKDEGRVIVEITGGTTGYANFWGATETQILDFDYNSLRYETEEDDQVSWEGSVHVVVSDSSSKSLVYADNQASYSSFSGGHMRVTNGKSTARCEYDLPTVDDDEIDDDDRNRGTEKITSDMLPVIERLLIPKFRDVAGHWAEEQIEKLYSLDVLEGDAQFFVPDVPMSRGDFVRAVVKACNIRVTDAADQKRTTRASKKPVEKSPFADVAVTDPDYEIFKDAVNKGIIEGVAAGIFGADEELTRAQAITILIRALGFENRAPNPGYITSFADNYQIPAWSKDSIYVAREIGLIKGDAYNRVNPNNTMTRAEACAMLVGFLEFLQQDLQRDYRDNIILYN